jgi:hypothetical protein
MKQTQRERNKKGEIKAGRNRENRSKEGCKRTYKYKSRIERH